MRYLISTTLLVVGVIHILPLVGVLSPERLQALYGLKIDDPNLAILMRHRAVLFGLIGGLMVLSAFYPQYQTIAFAAGFISVLSFLCLSWSAGEVNSQIQRVVIADIVALVCLVIGSGAKAFMTSRGG